MTTKSVLNRVRPREGSGGQILYLLNPVDKPCRTTMRVIGLIRVSSYLVNIAPC